MSDWSNSTLAIERSIYEVPGGGFGVKATKTHQGRRIGLDNLAVEVLRRHRAAVLDRAGSLELEVPEGSYMFSISPRGSEPIRPDVLTRFAARAAKAAGVDTHLHALRHFSATQGIAAGFDPVTVAGRLGHADPSITLPIYPHTLEQRDRDLAASLGRTLSVPSSNGKKSLSNGFAFNQLKPQNQETHPPNFNTLDLQMEKVRFTGPPTPSVERSVASSDQPVATDKVTLVAL